MVYNDLLSTPQLKEAYEAKIEKFEKHGLILLLQMMKKPGGRCRDGGLRG